MVETLARLGNEKCAQEFYVESRKWPLGRRGVDGEALFKCVLEEEPALKDTAGVRPGSGVSRS